MTKEKPLSEKGFELDGTRLDHTNAFWEEDVKEAVERLKEELKRNSVYDEEDGNFREVNENYEDIGPGEMLFFIDTIEIVDKIFGRFK